MTYLIGDLHGNVEALDHLLGILQPTPSDRIIFLGDYLDKNPNTRETLERLEQLSQQTTCTFLLGNHEYVWDRYVNHGEVERQEFILKYGGLETLQQLHPNPEQLIQENNLEELKQLLAPYFKLIAQCKSHVIVGDCLAIHAGLKPEQLQQDPLRVEEVNFFLRPALMNLEERYLGRYTVVGGHTHLSDEPVPHAGYINLDYGAGYGKYLAAFCLERHQIIRSDGKTFSL